jgi:hypothetical protein
VRHRLDFVFQLIESRPRRCRLPDPDPGLDRQRGQQGDRDFALDRPMLFLLVAIISKSEGFIWIKRKTLLPEGT